MTNRERGRPIKNGPPLQKRVSDVERAQGEQRRALGQLKDILNIKDNSGGQIKEWIGAVIEIQMTSKKTYKGILKWVDKYNYGVLCEDQPEGEDPSVIPKANVERVRSGKTDRGK